jgi:hypothetical protein
MYTESEGCALRLDYYSKVTRMQPQHVHLFITLDELQILFIDF